MTPCHRLVLESDPKLGEPLPYKAGCGFAVRITRQVGAEGLALATQKGRPIPWVAPECRTALLRVSRVKEHLLAA